MLILFAGEAAKSAFAGGRFIAVILTADSIRYRTVHEQFVDMVRAEVGKDIDGRIYVQTPNNDPLSLANSLRKAQGLGADLIVTYGAEATLAAKKEVRNTPILFADVYDPVRGGIIKSMKRPPKDFTGVSSNTPIATLVGIFREIYKAKKIAVIYSPDDLTGLIQYEELSNLAYQYGFELEKKPVPSPGALPEDICCFSEDTDAVFIADSLVLEPHYDEMMKKAAKLKVPVLSQVPGICEKGALISLEPSLQEQGYLVGKFTLDFLEAQSHIRESVRTPRNVSLVINLGVAKELGYSVPLKALGIATKVIE